MRKGSWDSTTLQWSNKPDYNTRVEDFQLVQNANWYSWDITDIAREWYSGGNNYGMMFKVPDEIENATASNNKTFCSSDNYVDNRPVLQIAYRNACGLEGYWDYHSHNAGRAGTSHINDYTGNLVFTHPVMGYGGAHMPVAITLTYNANDKDANNCHFGYGWRSNYHQTITAVTLNETEYLCWIDEDGTRHYFKKDGTEYKDEDGLELTITTSTGTTLYTMTDKKGNTRLFNASGQLYKIQNNQSTKSAVTVTYTSGRITKITDSAGGTYTFAYNSGNTAVTSITYNNGSEDLSTHTFTYSNNHLITSTFPDAKAVSFTYSSGHLMTRAQDIDGYALTYAYTTTATGCPSRVKKLCEFYGTTAGGELNIEYAHNQTTFTDYQGRKSISQFNNLGNTLSVQDDEGRASYWQYANDGSDETDTTKHNQVTAASKLQDSVVNLLKNGNCEAGDTWALAGSPLSETAAMSYSTEAKYLGTRSLKLTRTDTTGKAYIRQSVTLKPNTTYTLSAYMKTTGMAGTGTGAGIFMEYASASDVYTRATGTRYTGNTDWVRVETTLTTVESPYSTTLACYLDVGTAAGTAYFDCIQLEEAPTASRYNLVQNSNFTFAGSTTADALYWGKGSACGTNEKRVSLSATPFAKQDGYCFQITGIADNQRRVYQDIPVSGSSGDVYTLAGWAKGDSVPLHDSRKFGLGLRFYGTDGEWSVINYVNFNPDMDGSINSDTVDYTGWQFACGKIVAKSAYSKIRVMLTYEHNANTAWFDNIQLFKEEFGHSYVYDGEGNVTSVTDIRKKKTSYEWTDNDLTKMTLPDGASYSYVYDGKHNVTKATSGTGVVSNFTYDAKGMNTAVKVGSTTKPIESNAAFDSRGRMTTSTNPLRKASTFGYNSKSLLAYSRAPGEVEGTQTNYSYNSMDQVTQVSKSVSGLPVTVKNSYTYENDRIKTLTHSNTADASTTYTFNYGVFGLPTSIKAGEHTLVTNTYDTTNRTFNLLKALYGNGAYVEYTYDEYDRVVGMKYNGDTTDRYTFHYDNCGALGRVRDNANNLETCYLYDFAGRLVEVNTKGLNGNTYTNKFTWSYDDLGRVTSFKFWVNGNACYSNYAYDQDNRLTQFSIGGIKKTWGYDAYGRISSIQCKYNDVANVITTPTYTEPDTSHTSAQIKTWRNKAVDYDVTYSYTYDEKGNILSISDGTNTTSYTYDGLNQLTRENNQAANKTWVYTYDAGGNILSKIEYGYTNGEVVDPAATVNYEYNDAKGWKDILTSYNGVARNHDEIGNLLSDGTWNYIWEAGRRLKSMTKADGTTVTFAYDNKGLRLSKTVGDVTYRYTYNGGELVRIEDGTYTHNIRYDSAGQPMTIAYSGLEYFYVYNAQGDVMAIAKYDGTIVVEYAYDAWGNILSCTGSMAETLGKKNPFRYRGYVYDEETGLYYVSSRYYDPEIDRWINADSQISGVGGDIRGYNLFAYCFNNPVNMIDPTGNWPSWGQVFAAVATVAVAAVFVAAVVASAGAVGVAAGVAAASIGVTGTMVSAAITVGTVGTYAMAAGIGACALSNAGEILTGTNVIRDRLMGGNQEAYDTVQTALNVAGGGAMIIGQTNPGVTGNAAKPSQNAQTVHKVPTIGTPNTSFDKLYPGKAGDFQRTYYDFRGNISLQIDFTQHSKPLEHSYPHLHTWGRFGHSKQINLWYLE